jgi:hypothetical protein
MGTQPGPGDGRPDPGLNAIMGERRQLINLAYRLLGSLADAEDAAQETYARWYALSRQQREAIESPGAWLTKVASRICLDLLGSARARRERYVGEWIPEPLPDPATPAAHQASIVRAFKQAWEAGDINALIGLLAPEATATGDGGGLVRAVLRPVEGAEQIARFYADRASAVPNLTILERTVNGQPGLVAQLDGVTVTVMAFDVAGGQIRHIWAVLNPDKLRPWTTG